MVGPRFLKRVREGEPTFEILVLLDKHRVLTTEQIIRCTKAPASTVRYRLDQLRRHHLIDEHRPGRSSGSSPSHWWLLPAGAQLVPGAVAPHGGTPSPRAVAHAALVSEFWLTLHHGQGAGLRLHSWVTGRAARQDWSVPTASGATRRRRLTPDAVIHAQFDHDGATGDAVAFLEVDLSTLQQTQLREKIQRYLTYAEHGMWKGTFPHMPVLLLLTTTPTRALTFIRIAGQVLSVSSTSRLDTDGHLTVAACSLARDPLHAVNEAAWRSTDNAERTLTQLLALRGTPTGR